MPKKNLPPVWNENATWKSTRKDVDCRHGADRYYLVYLAAPDPQPQTNPTDREDQNISMARIKIKAEGAIGLINYAEQIADQLQRLGG